MLVKPVEKSKIRLVTSPYWIKIGPCPPESDPKELIHAIGSTFEGVISSEVKGDFCRLKVSLNVRNPLR